MTALTPDRVRLAHGDAWWQLGAGCADRGGGALELPGVRVTATGLPHPQWNNGDVHDPDVVDVAAVAAWFAGLHVPWGLRLPAGAAWEHGRHLFRKRLMAATPASYRPAAPVPGLEMRLAGPEDLESILPVDAVAFEESEEVERPWLQLLLGHRSTCVALATVNGSVVATGWSLRSEGRAGTTGYIAGIAVEPEMRRQGIGAAITSWLMEQVGSVELWHLHPDTDVAARIYERLGFTEVDGFDVYVDIR